MRSDPHHRASTPGGRNPGAARGCDHAACSQAGEFLAPRGRRRLNEYYWFCLDHVRTYNSAWNFCAGMNDAEIDWYIRNATCWERPTWRLGHLHSTRPGMRFTDGCDLFGDGGGRGPRRRPVEDKALAALDLEPMATWPEIKARYKTLVKRFHPDANGGDKRAEERLKTINQAYSILRGART